MTEKNASMWNSDRLLKLVVFVCFLLVAAFAAVLFQQTAIDEQINDLKDAQVEIQDTHEESRIQARQIKGIVCGIEYAIGLESSPVCVTPELQEYWMPENSVSPHFQETDRE